MDSRYGAFVHPFPESQKLSFVLCFGTDDGILRATNREHTLRYVLRNRKTDDVLFVVNFALIPITKEAEEEVAKKEPGVGPKEDETAQDDELD